MLKRLKLTYKLSIIVLAIIVVTVTIFGFYFDNFLKQENLENNKTRIKYVLKRLKFNFQTIEKELKRSLEFVDSDELFIASIDLINNYQDKKKYNAILIDEEKKILLNELLKKVKLSLNSQIVLYDKNEELVGYVYKKNGDYVQCFISYEDGEKVLYTKSENEPNYQKSVYKELKFGEFKHSSYYNMTTLDTTITYRNDENILYITSHKTMIEQKNKTIIAHIEMTNKISDGYYDQVSKDLNIPIKASALNSENLPFIYLFDNQNFDDLYLVQDSRFTKSLVAIKTDNGSLFVSVNIQKEQFAKLLNENRLNFLFLLMGVTIFILFIVRILFLKGLEQPLDKLMIQIQKIEKHNYTSIEVIKTGDELETISINIQLLATTINEREQQLLTSKDKLEHLSLHDPLTELPNRRYFYDKFEHVLQDNSNGKKVALLFLDLDQFKHVNDTLGHNVGDKLLIEVSHRFEQRLDKNGFLARLSGDEFNILLQDIEDKEDVIHFVEDILVDFQKPFVIEEHAIKITASIGIALYPEDGRDTISLSKHADLAMYHSKDLGRNSYTFFSQELADLIELRSLRLSAMRVALDTKDEFVLYYQPKISLHTGKITAVEALVRWNSHTLGFLSPDQFIPLAEETNLIIPLGDLVIQKAIEAFLHLQQSGYELEQISINVSGVQLENGDLVTTLQKTIEKTGIKASQIELEITESYIATNQKSAIEMLSKFRAMNIELAIDDFGTGYSSLSYLQKLPVTRLKIDKSFIDTIDTKESQSIINAIISLAKTFNLHITAEGVETESQLAFFHEKNCDEIQGFVYSKPLEIEEFKTFYNSFN